MPTMHAPFVQPSAVHGASFSPVVFAVMAASWESRDLDSFARNIAAHCHALPIFYSPVSPPLASRLTFSRFPAAGVRVLGIVVFAEGENW